MDKQNKQENEQYLRQAIPFERITKFKINISSIHRILKEYKC